MSPHNPRYKVLFLHWVFPCQFQHLARGLVERGHDVRVIMERAHHTDAAYVTSHYDVPAHSDGLNAHNYHVSRHYMHAEAVADAAVKMRAEGFVPDLIVGHFGKGETLFIKDVFPAARLIVYADIFFRFDDMNFDPEFRNDDLARRKQATSLMAPFLLAVEQADIIWTPTAWQASTIPAAYRSKVQVVFDGIDTRKCAPNPEVCLHIEKKDISLRFGDEILLFVARNLEPVRGYHRFMRALPDILRRRPEAQVLIAGAHGLTYNDPPAEGGSWKSRFLREVGSELDPSRVHMLGAVPYQRFLELAQIARAQVYLTQPYILSWSFFESMSCGAAMVGSRTAPVEEVIRDGDNGLLAGYFDTGDLVDKTVELLENPELHVGMRRKARQGIVENYDAATVCGPRQIGMCDLLMEQHGHAMASV